MAAVGRVLDFFFFWVVFFLISSPPLLAALAARAVALGGMLLDDNRRGGGGGDRSFDRSAVMAVIMEDRSIDPEMSFVVTGGCSSVLFENRRD